MTLPFPLPTEVSLDGYGRPSAISEADLIRGANARVEPCACGGSLELWPGLDVATVVGRHASTPKHAAWRRTMEGA